MSNGFSAFMQTTEALLFADKQTKQINKPTNGHIFNRDMAFFFYFFLMVMVWGLLKDWLTWQTALGVQLDKVGRTLAVAQRWAAAALDEICAVHVMLALVTQLQSPTCVEQCAYDKSLKE